MAITAALVLPVILDFCKGAAKGIGKFVSKYWRELVLLGALIATHAFIFNQGKEAADKLWIDKYNAKVTELNARIKALELSSVELGDEVDGAVGDVITDLDSIEEHVVREAEKEQRRESASAPVCRAQDAPVRLNDPLPKTFVEAWADMNEVGAKHNPYAQPK